MVARTHDVAAFTALVAVVIVNPPGQVTLATALLALFANQLGGIAPDLDQPTAPFWRNLPVGHYFGKLFGKMLGGHRFLSHSLVGLIIFGLLSKLLLEFLQPIMPHTDIKLVWYAFLIGVISHLVMDTFTKEGVPWLLPIPVKLGFPPLRRMRITTGQKAEIFIVLPVLIGISIWLCASHYAQLVALLQ